jgi:hypothetical protein
VLPVVPVTPVTPVSPVPPVSSVVVVVGGTVVLVVVVVGGTAVVVVLPTGVPVVVVTDPPVDVAGTVVGDSVARMGVSEVALAELAVVRVVVAALVVGTDRVSAFKSESAANDTVGSLLAGMVVVEVDVEGATVVVVAVADDGMYSLAVELAGTASVGCGKGCLEAAAKIRVANRHPTEPITIFRKLWGAPSGHGWASRWVLKMPAPITMNGDATRITAAATSAPFNRNSALPRVPIAANAGWDPSRRRGCLRRCSLLSGDAP